MVFPPAPPVCQPCSAPSVHRLTLCGRLMLWTQACSIISSLILVLKRNFDKGICGVITSLTYVIHCLSLSPFFFEEFKLW